MRETRFGQVRCVVNALVVTPEAMTYEGGCWMVRQAPSWRLVHFCAIVYNGVRYDYSRYCLTGREECVMIQTWQGSRPGGCQANPQIDKITP